MTSPFPPSGNEGYIYNRDVSHSVSVFSQTFQTGCVLGLNCDLREERLFGEVLNTVPQCEKGIVFVSFITNVLLPTLTCLCNPKNKLIQSD